MKTEYKQWLERTKFDLSRPCRPVDTSTNKTYEEFVEEFKAIIIEGLVSRNFEVNDNFPNETKFLMASKEDIFILVLCELKERNLVSHSKSGIKRKIGINDVKIMSRKCSALGVFGAIITDKYRKHSAKSKAKELNVLITDPTEALSKLSKFVVEKIDEREEEALAECLSKLVLEQDEI
ncbi:3625_t:CDS:2 [Cetraspora pellucida]|uniref:3625_t:CDS:1 n=1 Tax=Cetraspora pellucida TaxID=1433469 RepID=A0ACA9LKB2_9GLOM|nr:3625_t:CDS:2 [Cetraspora pellucida]